MSVKRILSFSSGEIDPILHDRVTLEKFKKGLATARNVMVGKTGAIMSRYSRAHFVKAKYDDQPIRIYSPPNSELLVEVGVAPPFSTGYIRFYDFSANLLGEILGTYSPWDLSTIQFEASKDFLYIFSSDSPLKIDLTSYTVVPLAFRAVDTPVYGSSFVPTGTFAWYDVDYAVTYVSNGEELSVYDFTGVGTLKRPDNSAASIAINVTFTNTGTEVSVPEDAIEMRVYRRPSGGRAFGLIGTSNDFSIVGGNLVCDYIDLGGSADFTNSPPEIITKYGLGGFEAGLQGARTGLVYQQRLLMGNLSSNEEAIIASRPGFQNNFQRDFPYDADSALSFKSGTSGKAKVLRMIEKDGLIVFTSIGVFINLGILNINNVALEKKGPWVIEEKVPPLVVPGGVFFVDKRTNAVRQFVFSEGIQAYQGTEESIFSAHLFKNKTIVSWGFQDGVAPVINVVFSDGTFATFTYNSEHRMRAWTRHESKYPVEEVAETGIVDSTFFVTNKNGNRYIEVTLPREIPADTYVSNPEADKLALNSFSDANFTKQNLLNDSLVGSDVFQVVPTVAGDWGSNLTLTCGTSALFPDPGLGEEGTIFRFFSLVDKSTVSLEVVSRTSDNEVVVRHSATFPSAQASGFRMYETFNQVTGLTHLEGENVSVMVDGYVVNSPNNDVDDYDDIIVSSGTITLPQDMRGAIIIVGRPIVADIKSLNISTVEQTPTLIESLSVEKVYVRLHESRGLYIDNNFPEEKIGEKDGSTVEGMESLDDWKVPSGYDITANRYKAPMSRRVEKTIEGDWDNNGQIAIRQVDPLHFTILSIIPDVELLRRSN